MKITPDVIRAASIIFSAVCKSPAPPRALELFASLSARVSSSDFLHGFRYLREKKFISHSVNRPVEIL